MTDVAPRLWARRWALLAIATVVTVAAVVVDAQPLRSPWWTYADADAAYTASALNLMLGRDVAYVDHPGLPLTEAVALAFTAQALVEERGLSERSRVAFVDRRLLDLDRTRGTFRGFAVAFYLLGSVLAFLLTARLLGHWSWGLAAGLLWVAAPGLIGMSIQLRPDVPLAVVTLVFAFALARAVERRSATWLAAAAFTAGIAAMVKLHALALVPALAVAALWRFPQERADADLARRIRRRLREHRPLAAGIAAAWLGVVVLVHALRWPFSLTAGQLTAVAVVVGAAAGTFALARGISRAGAPRPVRRAADATAVVVAAFAAGLLAPATITVAEGSRALVYIVNAISGRGVQQGVSSFTTPLSDLPAVVGTPVLLVFALALLAAVVGVLRGDPRPVVWTVAAASMGVMAFARPPNVHYFAPTFLLATLAVLAMLQREPRARTSLLVWPVVLYVFLPAWGARAGPAEEQERMAALVAPAKAYVDEHAGAGEIALVPSYWPFADARFFELVEIYVEHVPPYAYRYLPATAAARAFAAERGLRPRYFIGPQAQGLATPERQPLADFGEYTLAPVREADDLLAELVDGPGITEPW